MLGMAGGIFIVPVLTLYGGLSLHVAVAASLISVVACSCASSPPLLRAGLTNIRLAIVLEVATTIGAVTGVCLTGWFPSQFLFILFAAILLLSARQMVMRRAERATAEPSAWATSLRLHGTYPDRGADVPYYVNRLGLGLVLMYGAGMLSALLGIGSGVLKIPAMDSALRLPIKVSSGTSSFMIGVTGAASAIAYFIRGDVVTSIAGPVALGSVIGAVIGARLLMMMKPDRLRIGFALVLVALAVQMVWSVANGHAVGGG